MSDNNINENTGSLDSLDKERLLDILQAEFESESTDVELIMRVNKALDEKENVKDADVDAAWEHFLKLSAESEPIFDLEENRIVDISKARKPLRKVFIAIAAAIVILVGCTIVANANGIDLWGAIASWTAETFSFSQRTDRSSAPSEISESQAPREIPGQLEELAAYFDQYDISRDKLPTYIPEGYVNESTDLNNSPISTLFTCLLNNKGSNIILQYRLNDHEISETETQKDIPDPEILSINGIDFYIMSNEKKYCAVWIDGKLECTLYGVESRDEVIKIINSIYGDEQ